MSRSVDRRTTASLRATLTCSSNHPVIQSFIYPFINSSIHPCMHAFRSVPFHSIPFIPSFIHYSSIHSVSLLVHAISCHFMPFQRSFHSKQFSDVYMSIYIYTLYNYIIWLSVTSRSWFTPTVTDKTLPVGSSLTMTLCCFQNVRPASCGDYWVYTVANHSDQTELRIQNHQSPTVSHSQVYQILHILALTHLQRRMTAGCV